MSEQIQENRASADEYISISSVEETLIDLWSKMAEAQPNEAIIRATTLNLILHPQDPNTAPAIIGELTQGNPCRAIVIEWDSSASDSLRAMPTLFCRPSLGREARMQVCCEEIVVRVNHTTEQHLTAAVQSLLLSDLPVYVFREGEISPVDTLVKGLDEAIDGLIVDSNTFNSTAAGLRNLAALAEAWHERINIYDLNWQRLLPWRRALSRIFDNPNNRPALQDIKHVEIAHHGTRAQGLLLLGWLASRLHWRLVLERSTRDHWVARGQHGTIDLVMHGEMNTSNAKKKSVHGVWQVKLSTGIGNHSITLSPDGTYCISPDTPMPALLVPASSTGALVGAIIDQGKRDRVFEDSLAVASVLSSEASTLSQRAGIIVAEDGAGLARLAARHFVQTARHVIHQRQRFTVALSGGSTPKALFALLAEAPYRDQIEWSKVHIFWGDERDVTIDHPDSNQRMANETLLSKVPIPPGNIHGLLTGQLSAADVAARYAAEIRAFFGIDTTQLPEFDLILLGLGDDGHTASLFPNTVALNADANRLVVANPVSTLNTTRITFTAGLINNADEIVFLVSGMGKANMVKRVFKGPLTPDVLPAQLIHPTNGVLLVMADKGAAAKLND